MNWRAGLLALMVTVLAPVMAGCGGDDDAPAFFPEAPLQTFPPETRSNVLSLANVQVRQGRVSPVEIRLVNPSDVAGVQGRILYDANLLEVVNPATLPEPVNAFSGSVLSAGGQINYEENRAPVNGQKGVTFAVGSATGTSTSGRLMRLYFRPKAGTAGNASTLKVDPNFPFLMAGPRGEVLASNTAEGSIIIVP